MAATGQCQHRARAGEGCPVARGEALRPARVAGMGMQGAAAGLAGRSVDGDAGGGAAARQAAARRPCFVGARDAADEQCDDARGVRPGWREAGRASAAPVKRAGGGGRPRRRSRAVRQPVEPTAAQRAARPRRKRLDGALQSARRRVARAGGCGPRPAAPRTRPRPGIPPRSCRQPRQWSRWASPAGVGASVPWASARAQRDAAARGLRFEPVQPRRWGSGRHRPHWTQRSASASSGSAGRGGAGMAGDATPVPLPPAPAPVRTACGPAAGPLSFRFFRPRFNNARRTFRRRQLPRAISPTR